VAGSWTVRGKNALGDPSNASVGRASSVHVRGCPPTPQPPVAGKEGADGHVRPQPCNSRPRARVPREAVTQGSYLWGWKHCGNSCPVCPGGWRGSCRQPSPSRPACSGRRPPRPGVPLPPPAGERQKMGIREIGWALRMLLPTPPQEAKLNWAVTQAGDPTPAPCCPQRVGFAHQTTGPARLELCSAAISKYVGTDTHWGSPTNHECFWASYPK